jgi:hypothetical protein
LVGVTFLPVTFQAAQPEPERVVARRLTVQIRLAMHESRMEHYRDEIRSKIAPEPSWNQARADEWNARQEPIRRNEDATIAAALRELRRDLKAWESASEPE